MRDHCHFTCEYRGAAHNKCNLNCNCRKPSLLPVIFHNLQGYESHLFIKQLLQTKGTINCIPSTDDHKKHISLSKKINVDEYELKYDLLIVLNSCKQVWEISFRI